MHYATYNATSTAHTLNPGGMLALIVLAIAAYLFYAYCLAEIARKTNTPNEWFAWIPILNIVLMLQIIRKSLWWLLALLIPFVNILVLIWVWAKISQERRRPWWWGILMVINPINLIFIWLLAFREAQNEITPASPPPAV